MAAILNPTALTAPATQTGADLAESLLEGSSSVAPWNRAEAFEPRPPVRHPSLINI